MQPFRWYDPKTMEAVVLFADLLGFTALTEAYEADEDDFEAHDSPETDEFLTASLETASPLVQTYTAFRLRSIDVWFRRVEVLSWRLP
jgi:hypothetical protein